MARPPKQMSAGIPARLYCPIRLLTRHVASLRHLWHCLPRPNHLYGNRLSLPPYRPITPPWFEKYCFTQIDNCVFQPNTVYLNHGK